MKKMITLLLVLTGMVCTASADTMYIMGNIPFGDWQPNAGLLMTDNGDGTFSYESNELSGTIWFVFTEALSSDADNWDVPNANDYRPTGSATLSLGTWYTSVYEKGSTSANRNYSYGFTFESGTNYVITFDKTNLQVLVNKKIENIYIIGTLNGAAEWSSSSGIAMEKEGTTFSAYVTATGEQDISEGIGYSYFSFSTALGTWEEINTGQIRFGAVSDDAFLVTDEYIDTPLSLQWRTNYDPKAYKIPGGVYKLTVDSRTFRLTITKAEKVTTNSSGYCTYVNTNPLTISGAKAYYSTDNGNGCATARALTNPVAGTPMLIHGTGDTTYYFDVVASGTPIEGKNAFQVGNGSAVDSTDGNVYNYILNGDAFYLAAGKTVATGKAYLQLSQQASARPLVFEDEDVTGIHAVENAASAMGNEVYDLSGRKVAQPTKGLYIVNGKKAVIK